MIFAKNEIVVAKLTGNEDIVDENLVGFRSGKDIYLPPQDFLNTISVFCHEVGHVLGNEMSFQTGLYPGEKAIVTNFDEIKSGNLRIKLEPNEIVHIMKYLSNNEPVPIEGLTLSIALKLLDVFSKGNFTLTSIISHNVTQEELHRLVAEKGSSTTTTKQAGTTTEILVVNSKSGRNEELSSYTTEVSCLLILENTLKWYGIYRSDGAITISASISPPHQRAINIISRAFSGKGWRIPSMLDINLRSDTPSF